MFPVMKPTKNGGSVPPGEQRGKGINMVELDEAHNMKVILKKQHNRNKVVYNRTETCS